MRANSGVCLVLLLSGWAGAAPEPAASPTTAPPLPAFPGAEGAGMHATGGRGGTGVRGRF